MQFPCSGHRGVLLTVASCFWPPPRRDLGCLPWRRTSCRPNCTHEAPSHTGWVASRSPHSASPGAYTPSPTCRPPAESHRCASSGRPCIRRRSGSRRRYSAPKCGRRAPQSAGFYPQARRSGRWEGTAESRRSGCGCTPPREEGGCFWSRWCSRCRLSSTESAGRSR